MENLVIKLDGFGINRAVYKDGELFATDSNWSVLDAKAIEMGNNLAKGYEDTPRSFLGMVLVKMAEHLPAGNFSVEVNISKIQEDLKIPNEWEQILKLIVSDLAVGSTQEKYIKVLNPEDNFVKKVAHPFKRA